ncbi:MAG: hypothetical protein WCA34_11430 [Candidatus Acidiferrales bacterium]
MADAKLAGTLYKILSWSSLAGLILTIVLVLHKSPAPDIPYDPNAAERAEQKFAAADQAKAAGQAGSVALDRSELNSYLAQNLQTQTPAPVGAPTAGGVGVANGAAPAAAADSGGNAANDPSAALAAGDPRSIEDVQSSVKDVKVDMVGDLVKAYVIFDFHGKDISLELDGHLSSENGFMKFEPVSGKLGSLPLPQSTLNAAVEKMMASPENRDKLKLPDDISDIKIVDGQAVIQYKQ